MMNYEPDPIYETQEDYDAEQRVADIVAQKWLCEMQRNKKLSPFDFIAHRDGVPRAFIEMRKRHNPMHQYSSVMVSLTKIIAAKQHTEATGLPCFFVVEWTDAIGYVNFDCQKYLRISGKGWNRRNPPDEVEVIEYISNDQFQILK